MSDEGLAELRDLLAAALRGDYEAVLRGDYDAVLLRDSTNGTVAESEEVSRHRHRLDLQAAVRDRIAALNTRQSTRSSTLLDTDRMLIEQGFGWVVALANQRTKP